MKSDSRFYIICMLILFIFTGCSYVTSEKVIPPQDYYNLFRLSKDYFVFCLYIMNQESSFFGQMVSRLYYAYYHIARAIHVSKAKYLEKQSHAIIWHQMKKTPRKIYGVELKKLREYYDYNFDSVNKDTALIKAHMDQIIKDAQGLDVLIEDAIEQINKYFDFNEYEKAEYEVENDEFYDKNQWIDKCLIILDEIKILHTELINKIKNENNS